MQKTFVQVLAFSALLLGCGADPQPRGTEDKLRAPASAVGASDAGESRARDAAAHHDPDAGEKSDVSEQRELDSAVATASCDVMRCERQGERLAQSLMMPSSDVTSVKGGDCTRVDIVGVVAGMACTCLTSNGWIYIGPDGAGCFARGRAGDCLWDDSEWKTCTRGDPMCPAACEELGKRYAADAAKSFDVTVRASTCRDGSCRHVLRIDKACYTDRSIDSGRHFDCSLSDSEILDREDSAR